MKKEIEVRKLELKFQEKENKKMINIKNRLNSEVEGLKHLILSPEEKENLSLFIKLAELQSEYRNELINH